MKKIYLSIFALITALTSSAQLTQANHAPALTETYSMYRCDSVTTSPGASGANAVWNFSTITTYSNLIRNYAVQPVSSTTYPSANRAVGSAVNDVAYLESAASYLKYFGGNITVGPVSGALTYTDAAIYAAYPMSLNTTSAAAIGGTINVTAPIPANGSFTGNSSVLVDGSGTISLPGSVTFTNALRVVTSQTLDIVTVFASATVTQVNYDYYASGIKAPVFSISTSTAFVLGSATSQTFVTRNKDLVAPPTNTNVNTVSISENVASSEHFDVFPNPSNDFVNFATNHLDAKQLTIYDMTGKIVEKQNLIDGKTKLDVSSYNKGLYLYTISSSENRILKSGKITVSH